MDRFVDWLLSDKFVTVFTALCAMVAALRVPFSHREHSKSMKAIKENTEISTQAFDQANSVNQKIASIGAEQVLLQAQQNAIQKQTTSEPKP